MMKVIFAIMVIFYLVIVFFHYILPLMKKKTEKTIDGMLTLSKTSSGMIHWGVEFYLSEEEIKEKKTLIIKVNDLTNIITFKEEI